MGTDPDRGRSEDAPVQNSVARSFVTTLALALALAAGGATASESGTAVSAVQLPAWVERGGRVVPVRPGFTLEPGDVLITGAKGRVHVDTPDGSIVKLGSSGRIGLDTLRVRTEPDGAGLFDGALNVVKGAFRFTTRLAGKASRRDVRVRVGVVTAGIRGTDIWGKSDDEKDLVCLLEGKIAVASDGQPEQTMDGTNLFDVVPKGQAPKPIAPVDPNKVVNEWAPQTEMAPDAPTLVADGDFMVIALSQTSAEGAEFIAGKLAEEGYPAEVDTADGRYFRVSLRSFATLGEAQAMAAQLEGIGGIRGAYAKRR
jgi:hypothetical protein